MGSHAITTELESFACLDQPVWEISPPVAEKDEEITLDHSEEAIHRRTLESVRTIKHSLLFIPDFLTINFNPTLNFYARDNTLSMIYGTSHLTPLVIANYTKVNGLNPVRNCLIGKNGHQSILHFQTESKSPQKKSPNMLSIFPLDTGNKLKME